MDIGALFGQAVEPRDPLERHDQDYAPLAKFLGRTVQSVLSRPRRMMESSEELRTGGDYNPAPFWEQMQGMLGRLPLAPRGAGVAGGRLGRRPGPSDYEEILRKGRTAEAEAALPTGPERIKWAAMRDPQGNTYEGPIHHDAKLAARDTNPEITPDTFLQPGFTTSKGRFVSREEAARLAEASGQVEPGYTRSTGGLDAADYYNPERKAWWDAQPKEAAKPRASNWLEEVMRGITK